jgi:DNA-binding NarL/FixJ family response regulator
MNFQENIKVIGVENDGKSCFSSLSIRNADVLIIDVLMPLMDGISILHELKNKTFCPSHVIIITFMYSEYFKTKADNIGSSIFPKSINKEKLIQEIHYLTDKKNHLDEGSELDVRIRDLLLSLGIPSHYLYEAIRMLISILGWTRCIYR